MNTIPQQDQPQPGTVYALSALGKTRSWAAAAVKQASLPLGARVSYGDAANPRRKYVVVDAAGGPHGQHCIREDGKNASNVSQSYIDGPGGWQREQGEATEEEIIHLKELHAAHMQDVRTTREREQNERAKRVAIGRNLIAERQPAGSVAVIVAKYEVDESDMVTDYFSTKTTRTVILAFSSHKRDLFAEMRKAAALFSETAHLATADHNAEHREKHSLGSGYYLKSGGCYSTGWTVSKTCISDNLAEIAGLPDGWAPHFTAPKQISPGDKTDQL